MHPFNKSAMDGYVCRFADHNLPMSLAEVIAAGAISTKTTGVGDKPKP